MNDDHQLLPQDNCRWQDWIVPIACEQVSLAEALETAHHIAAQPRDIPLIVRLCENPKFEIPGFGFDGAVTLDDHDCIHALLGRGLRSKDEAFVVGFTMGSTNRVSTTQETLYAWASQYLYPKPYRFRDSDVQVYRDAVRLGYVSDCQPLNQVDFQPLLSKSLAEARTELGIETDLLRAHYRIEAKRYPKSEASQRLLASEAG